MDLNKDNPRLRLPEIGRNVILKVPHPHANKVGLVEYHTDTLVGLGAIIKIDQRTVFVFKKFEWEYV